MQVTGRHLRWEALAAELRDGIESGQYGPGTLLPSVRAMKAAHGVSDDPVRRALRALADEGLVVSEPGRGVRVVGATEVPPGMEERVSALEVWVREHAADGHTHG